MNHTPRVILIVDDDENDRLFLSRALHDIAPELSTHTVDGGAEAMAYLEMKANSRWAIVPAIVFSSSTRLEDVTKAFLCGACAYHIKPHNAADREKLCHVLLEYWSMSEVPQSQEEPELTAAA